jgi:hypothetical protein
MRTEGDARELPSRSRGNISTEESGEAAPGSTPLFGADGSYSDSSEEADGPTRIPAEPGT